MSHEGAVELAITFASYASRRSREIRIDGDKGEPIRVEREQEEAVMNDSKFEFQMLNRLSTFMIDKEIKSNRKSLILK